MELSTLIRLKQIQLEFWLYDNPVVCWPKPLQHYRHRNYLSNMLTTYFQSAFSFINSQRITDLFKIKGGDRPLQNIIPWTIKDIKTIKNQNILFLSQVVATGRVLLDYPDLNL